MPDNANNPFSFFKELKRRKVIRTTLVYLASAFAILEAADIILPRLGFPEWTLTLVIYLLGFGLITVIILSWIYDITPEGIKITESLDRDKKENEVKDPGHVKSVRLWKILTLTSIVIIAFFVVMRLLEIRSDHRIGEPHNKSIAVMPFQNLTGDNSWDYLETGISEILINRLGSSAELSVRSSQKMHEVLTGLGENYQASMIPTIHAEAARKTLSEFYVQGNFQLVTDQIHIMLNLVNTDNSDIEWTAMCSGNQSDYIQMVDSISDLLTKHFDLTSFVRIGQRDMRSIGTSSMEAYKYSILATRAHYDVNFPLAIKYWKEALDHDSTFMFAYSNIEQLLSNSGQYEKAEHYRHKAYQYYDNASDLNKIELDISTAFREDKDMRAAIGYLKEKINLGANTRGAWYDLGHFYRLVQQYENAIGPFEKALEIDESWGGGWKWLYAYYWLGYCYHKTGKYKKEGQIYELALKNIPGHGIIYQRKAILALIRGKKKKFDEYLTHFQKWYMENFNAAYYERELGYTYLGANQITTAESHFRKQLERTPDERIAYYDLGWLLIKEDIDIDEGIRLIDQALKMAPGSFSTDFRLADRYVLNMNSLMYFAKGVANFKKHCHEQALELFHAAWEEKALYNHDLFLYIQKTERALASQHR